MSNIAIVVLDSLRKDTFDTYFDWLPGMRFENAWSTSHYTVPVHASLFTGLYPSEVGVHSKNEIFNTPEPTLPEQLNDIGYTTRSFSENFLFSPLNDFDRGFDEFRCAGRAARLRSDIFNWKQSISKLNGNGPIRDLRAISKCVREDCKIIPSIKYGWNLKQNSFSGLKEMQKYISRTEFGSREFFIANLMQTHLPYKPPKSYRSTDARVNYSESNADSVLAGDVDYSEHRTLYKDCAQYLSDMYKDIFFKLSEEFDYIMTLSDHGELFGEYGAVKHWYGIYPELTHIPLVLYDGIDEHRNRNELVSLLDVHKTATAIAGLNATSRGQDLRSSINRSTCLTEFMGLRKERIKRLEDRGFSQETISEYDRKLCGIAIEPDYYGFETPTGYMEDGTSPVNNPQALLKTLAESITERSIKSNKEFPEDIKRHLEDLGYR